ncbi:MAG: hypothetical protein HN730_01755, partial [Bdellovibrionales bacterium]|nr:hypothetical protein [Bdellovibrionales bacterium]
GGAHLLFDTIKEEIGNYFEWPKEIRDDKVIHPSSLGLDPRYINCVGFMLLARDQIAMEHDADVDPNFDLKRIITDITDTTGTSKKGDVGKVQNFAEKKEDKKEDKKKEGGGDKDKKEGGAA